MRRREIWFAALLGSLTAAGCAKTQAKTEKADKTDTPVVLVGRPVVQEVTSYEEFIGHTDAIFSVSVTARVSGYLDKVNFNDGDEVEKSKISAELPSATWVPVSAPPELFSVSVALRSPIGVDMVMFQFPSTAIGISSFHCSQTAIPTAV